jgi:hypothetical protein
MGNYGDVPSTILRSWRDIDFVSGTEEIVGLIFDLN